MTEAVVQACNLLSDILKLQEQRYPNSQKVELCVIMMCHCGLINLSKKESPNLKRKFLEFILAKAEGQAQEPNPKSVRKYSRHWQFCSSFYTLESKKKM